MNEEGKIKLYWPLDSYCNARVTLAALMWRLLDHNLIVAIVPTDPSIHAITAIHIKSLTCLWWRGSCDQLAVELKPTFWASSCGLRGKITVSDVGKYWEKYEHIQTEAGCYGEQVCLFEDVECKKKHDSGDFNGRRGHSIVSKYLGLTVFTMI